MDYIDRDISSGDERDFAEVYDLVGTFTPDSQLTPNIAATSVIYLLFDIFWSQSDFFNDSLLQRIPRRSLVKLKYPNHSNVRVILLCN